LASAQQLDEANGGKEPDGDASGKQDEKSKEGEGWPRVLADGMYAAESVYMTPFLKGGPAVVLEYCMVTDVCVTLSALLLRGNLFTGAVLATALAKLVL
jgi:coatomer subunit beta